MNRLKINIFLVLALMFVVRAGMSQSYRVVRIEGREVGDSIVTDQIFRAINADSTDRRLSPVPTIYELKRGQVYFETSTIKPNYDFYLRAQDSVGPLPFVFHTSAIPVNQGVPMIDATKNLTLENIEFEFLHADGVTAYQGIRANGVGTRVILRGCRISHDRGSITLGANDMDCYIYDCVIGNMGNRKTWAGNGRFLDIRNKDRLDTVVIQNCTAYNLTDRFLRNFNGPVVNYIKIDHVTLVNCQSQWGCIQLVKTKNSEITNNIFYNPITMGDRQSVFWAKGSKSELVQPAPKHFTVVSHDNYANSSIVMRNNNVTFDQKFIDLFNRHYFKNDTVYVPAAYNAVVGTKLGTDAANAYFEEPLNWSKISSVDSMVAFVKHQLENAPASGSPASAIGCPDNWTDLFPEEMFLATYNTNSKTYTAGDDGLPLGNLNAWPNAKATWLQNNGKSSPVAAPKNNIDDVRLYGCYPNPMTDQGTRISFFILEPQKVEIGVYSTTGKKICILSGSQMPNGSHSVVWDGKDSNGNEVPNGSYIYYLKGEKTKAAKILLKQ